jgi:cytochrome P450
MCIKEGLRLHAPVPFIQRQIKSPITIDGKTFPAGTMMNTSLFALNHNPTVWDDSMTYDPERFSKENIDKIDTFAFCPFSAGPRYVFIYNFV